MEIKNISKKYNDRLVVNSVSFEINKGKITSLIGPNGAGKSTVMGIMTRLITQDAGEVVLEGREIRQWRSNELAKKIAILTQTNNISMKLTVKELVSFGRYPYSKNRLNEKDIEIVNKSISYMELTEYQDNFIDELSGGQRQRALIAMIIAQDTEYIFLDEPTNNLDIYHSTKIMKMVRNFCDNFGKTVVMVLHDINYASFYSDYICVFKNGEIFKYGTVDDVITKENLSNVYNVDFKLMQVLGKPLSIYY